MKHLFIKDLKLFLSDKRAVLLTFLLPIILISLFAFAFGGVGKDKSPTPKRLLVADLDQSKSSKEIVSKLDSLQGLRVVHKSVSDAKELIVKGKSASLLIFHPGFEKAIATAEILPLELMYDQAQEIEIGMLHPVLMGTIMSSIGKKRATSNISSFLDENYGYLGQEAKDKILHDIQGNQNISSNTENKSVLKMTSVLGDKKDGNLGLIQAVAGTAILMLLFSVAGIGASILDEKEGGTLNRLMYSPLKSNTILFGKMLFTFFIAFVQLIVMFVFSWLAFGLDITTNIPALLLMILATGFAVSSFGIFLAAIAKTRQQANGLNTLIILSMSAIGGSMIPLFIMPAFMKKIAVFTVNYWGIEGFFDIFWRQLPLIDILPRILVLIGIGVGMTLISLRLFKRNLKRMT